MENSAQDLQLRELRDTIKELNKLVVTLNNTIGEMTAERDRYREEAEYFKKKLFGTSSEKRRQPDVPGQLSFNFFNEAEATVAESPSLPEEDLEDDAQADSVSGRKKRKRKTTKEEKFKGCRVEKVYLDIPDDQKNCPRCGTPMVPIGEEFVRREISFVPAKVKVTEYYSRNYECPKCRKDAELPTIVKGRDFHIHMLHGMASASTVAWVMFQKYFNGMPLYRQEASWKELGIDISRTTMANWIISNTTDFLTPVYNYLHRLLVTREFLMADETPVQVLKEEGRRAESKSYMWIFRTGEKDEKPIILFKYYPSRAGNCAVDFLKGFKGYLMCDGYAGYNKVKDIIRLSCWAHARRYLIDAIPKGSKYDITNPAVQGLTYIDRLYKYEGDIQKRYKNPDLIKKARDSKEKPVLDSFWIWIDAQKPTPGTRFDTAVSYIRKRKDLLGNYLQDGSCSFDNNRTEQMAKAFVIGRKAWLFCDTVAGADASSVLYSLVETAKANGINVNDYLTYLLEKTPTDRTSDEELEKLMPWNPDLKAELERCSSAEAVNS